MGVVVHVDTAARVQLALRLFLQCAHAADRVNFSYDFFSQVQGQALYRRVLLLLPSS